MTEPVLTPPLTCPVCGGALSVQQDGYGDDDTWLIVQCDEPTCRAEWNSSGQVLVPSRRHAQ